MEVVFFPKEQYPISVCDHRHNKKMTCTFQADNHTIESYTYMCNLASTLGIRLGVFYGKHAQGSMAQNGYAAIKQAEAADICRTDIYFPAPAGSDRTVLYTEEQYISLVNEYKSWLQGIVNRIPSVFSYAYGADTYTEFAKDYWLAARNSEEYNQYVSSRQNYLNYGKKAFDGNFVGTPQILYNPNAYTIDQQSWISQPSTTRWDHFIKDNINNHGMSIDDAVSDAVSKMSALLDACYNNGGWFRDFVHWDDYYPQTGGWYKNFTEWTTNVDDVPFNPLDKMFTALFNMIVAKSYFDDIHFCSWGEAIEYMVARMMVKKVSAYTPKLDQNAINIALEVELSKYNNIQNIQGMLNIPISLLLSLANTPLSGKTVVSKSEDVNIIQSGNNVIIELYPYRTQLVTLTD